MSNAIRHWSQVDNSPQYRRITLPRAGQIVPTITCLLFSKGRIIVATDTASIYVYSADTGSLRHTLNDHKDGVWALQTIDDMLVSGSVDKTIRVWDLESGQCTYVFAGHQSTVRCLQIIKPSWNVYIDPESRTERREWWPARPYLVSGGRDASVRLWALPSQKTDDVAMGDDNCKRPSYRRHHLKGHEKSVKDIAARGRIAVSASYDTTLRVWDLVEGECRRVLRGHTERVQCVVIDPVRPQAYSGSVDTSICVWNIFSGECLFVLTGHTGIIGVLSASPSHLVSAAADETVRVWNPDTGVMLYSLNGGTTVYNDGVGLCSGSTALGRLQLWKDGMLLREFPGPTLGCWSTLLAGEYCVCAGAEQASAVLDVWRFGASDAMDVDRT